jgi:hypothetical protein
VAADVSEDLRAAVARRAGHRCEYCLIHEDDCGFNVEVDHIVSRKHDGPSSSENLAYACSPCNRYKGTDVAAIDPRTGTVLRLFHPRRDRWDDHFKIVGAVIEPITGIGEATVRLLRMNASERVAERNLLQTLGRYPG